jgi:glutaredoxin 3
MEKAWLSEKGIDFEVRDVIEDDQAMKELEELDVYSTPVTVIGDEVVIGFDRKKLEKLLQLA